MTPPRRAASPDGGTPSPKVPAGVQPPEFLELAAHPVRWRLLGELAGSDRKVQELTDAVGEAQNLVSYHLGKLRRAGLVTSRRSSADGRDTYYHADLPRIGALLSATATAIHPALAPTPLARSTAEGARTITVLFLCTGNSARSQMAEALLRRRAGGAVDVASAGSAPKPLHPHALRVLRDDYAIDIADHTSKHVDVFDDRTFDWVITLCDRVREVCPEVPARTRRAHWSIADPAAPDPTGRTSYRAFRQTAAELDTRIGFLLAALTDRR